MVIEILDKSVLPAVFEVRGIAAFELMLHGLSVTNTSAAPAEIEEVALALKKADRTLLARHFSGESLAATGERAAQMLAACSTQPFVPLFWLSRELDPSSINLGEPGNLQPDEGFWIVNTFFSMRGEVPDALEVTARFRSGGEPGQASATLPLQAYELKNEYIFPLSGWACCLNGPAMGLSGHRGMTSQEFAYDIVLFDEAGNAFMGEKNEDFPGFGADILAPSDGVVVEAKDGLPENPGAGDPPPLTPERVEEWGIEHAAAGNYIVIDHGSGEFSFIAHCKNGSVLVSVGDEVKRGQKIAAMGNTGNSTGPHLHYHLMDGPGFLGGRSLPVEFVNADAWPSAEDEEDEPHFWTSMHPLITTSDG